MNIMNIIVQQYDKYALSYPKTKTFLLIVANYYIAKTILKCLLKLIIKPKRSLLTRYGEDSWVVLMGDTRGICRELCVQLAREGFNIAIICDQQNALEMFEAANACFGVQTKIIEIQEEQDLMRIQYELQELDISFLVNNQEIELDVKQFERLSLNYVLQSLKGNALQTLILTKLLFQKLLARPKCRSCIIQLSYSCHGLDVANQAFQTYFIQSLQLEYTQIDFFLAYPPNRIKNQQKYVQGLLDKLRQGEQSDDNFYDILSNNRQIRRY